VENKKLGCKSWKRGALNLQGHRGKTVGIWTKNHGAKGGVQRACACSKGILQEEKGLTKAATVSTGEKGRYEHLRGKTGRDITKTDGQRLTSKSNEKRKWQSTASLHRGKLRHTWSDHDIKESNQNRGGVKSLK